ncbi:MAG: DUF192 domain-containing protein [Candidatus Aminicenantes bacterium]|nr:DUF192 domain-containing protein [Candidatus Aminicenantes bacterium]
MTVVRPAVQGGRFIEVYTAEGRTIVVELAVTPEERARGLMFREKILPGQGMLFLFEKEGKPAFWMKNTLVPLDILWLDRDRRIVHIEPDVPPCPAEPCPSYGPGRDALYVLELAAGEAKRYNLKLFDGLRFVLPDRLREFISPRNRRP